MKKQMLISILVLWGCCFLIGKANAEAGVMIENGKQVKMHYTLKVDGEIVDSTVERGPFEFVYGSDQIIPGVERNIQGLQAGDKRAFEVPNEDAYGPSNPAAVVAVPRENFPAGDIKVGSVFTTSGEGGMPLRGTVINLEGESVILDFNHPLAGKDLYFEVEVLEVG